jgi:hypothetical protein
MSPRTIGRWSRLASALDIGRRELTWAAVVASLVMLITCVPYLYGWLHTPKGMVYMGYVYEVPDHLVHSSWLRQVEMGEVLLDDAFTTDPQTPHFFHIYALVLGSLARLFHLPLMMMEQSARLISGWVFLIIVYALAAQFTQSLFTRRLALLLTSLSSGLGWLVNRTPQPMFHPANWAMDYVPQGAGLIMTEAITFNSLMMWDLFAFSYLMLALTFYLLWLAWKRASWRLAVCSGIAAAVVANVHTWDIITVWAVASSAAAALGLAQRRWPRREIAMLALVVALSAVPAAYQYHLWQTSEVFREKAMKMWSPPPFDEASGRAALDYLTGVVRYLLTFGLCALAAALAVGRALVRRDAGWLYLSAGAVVPFALVYVPVQFQRRMAEGMHVPICILAALAVGDMLVAGWNARLRAARKPALSPARRWAVGLTIVALTIPSNVAMIGLILQRLSRAPSLDAQQGAPPFYLPREDLAAMQWLAAHSAPRDAVLALSMNSVALYLPRVSGNHTYVTHWAESIDFVRKRAEVLRFFGHSIPSPGGRMRPAMTNEERVRLARANHLRYVYYRRGEARMAKMAPDALPFLKLVYANREVRLYRFDT